MKSIDKEDVRARLSRGESGHSIALLYGVCDSVISTIKTKYVNPAHSPERRASYRSRERESIHSYDKTWRVKLKTEVFEKYGGVKCALCPESRLGALQLDHVGQDGSAHRERIGILVGPIYRWVKKNDYPPGFRVLCSNCNFLAYRTSRPPPSPNTSARSKKKRSMEVKADLMGKLGGSCKVCGEDDIRVLTVHHPGYDGKEHRQRVSKGQGSSKFYSAVLKSTDLSGLECLCMSCNDCDACN